MGKLIGSVTHDLRESVNKLTDRFQMTGAYSHMGVNARDGVVSFLNVMSAERGATSNWKVDKPTEQELPTLRQISDLA